jgi:hypothetical protein
MKPTRTIHTLNKLGDYCINRAHKAKTNKCMNFWYGRALKACKLMEETIRKG